MRTGRAALAALIVTAATLGVMVAHRGGAATSPTPQEDVGTSTLPSTSVSAQVAVCYRAGIDSLTLALGELGGLPSGASDAVRQAAFRRARRAYKRVEFLVADLLPDAEIALNGAALPRPHESTFDVVLPPTGFQVMEAVLFPAPAAGADTVIRRQIRLMSPSLTALRRVRFGAAPEARIFDAARQEIARVSTLGIAGFDATVSGDGLAESAEALQGLRAGLDPFRSVAGPSALQEWKAWDARLSVAIAALQAGKFDAFDRLVFIRDLAKPAADALSAFQTAVGVGRDDVPGGWNTRASTIFDPGALDPLDYAPSDAAPVDGAVVALGRALFFDARLSRDGRRACATCHQPRLAFADGRALPAVDPGAGRLRNTPSLINAGLQPFQFADARVRSIEDQVAAVLENPREMNLPLAAATARLAGDSALMRRFALTYGGGQRSAITPRRVQTALAAFVRSLTALDSRFDRAVRGDSSALTAEERHGFTLFMGKAACATCHFLPTFGGSLPPTLLESEPEVIGVPVSAVRANARLDPDLGVAGFDHATIHRHAFKTPTLRNVALTAPYMHNGVFHTLDQVVDFYDRGGGVGIGIKLPGQTLSPNPLHLSRGERRALIAFLRTLTDTAFVSATLPPIAARSPTPPPRPSAP